MRIVGWLIASGVGALFPILAASAIRTVTRSADFRIVTDTGFDLFQVSVAPVIAALIFCALLWEVAGRGASAIGYAAAASALAFVFLETYFFVAYGAQPSLAIDKAEGALLASFAAGGASFAGVRRLARHSPPG